MTTACQTKFNKVDKIDYNKKNPLTTALTILSMVKCISKVLKSRRGAPGNIIRLFLAIEEIMKKILYVAEMAQKRRNVATTYRAITTYKPRSDFQILEN